jgi:hypothetical protein
VLLPLVLLPLVLLPLVLLLLLLLELLLVLVPLVSAALALYSEAIVIAPPESFALSTTLTLKNSNATPAAEKRIFKNGLLILMKFHPMYSQIENAVMIILPINHLILPNPFVI